MSMHPYINMGHGYELDISDDNVFNRLAEIFSEQAKKYQDEDGNIADFTGFLYEISENYWDKYPGVNLVIIEDDDFKSVLIVDQDSERELYDKYGSNNSGLIRPQKLYYYTTESLKKFADDLGLKKDPEILIWTYWN